MAGILGLLMSGAGLIKDQYFNLTTLLLPGNGTNGAQNNTFLDSSSNNFTITRNGNTTQGTFSPFSQTGWGNYFNGSNAYFNFAAQTDFAFGTGDFTIETFVFLNSTGDQTIIDFRPSSTNGAYPLIHVAGGKFNYYANTAGRIDSDSSVVANRWYHLVVSRVGTTTRMFVDGVAQTQTYSDSTNYIVGTSRPTIGVGGFNLTAYLNGYLSNFRILKGTGFTTVTVPTAPFATGTTNQVLLTCQANRFVDSNTATTAKTITVTGSPSVVAFSPFAPTAAYTTAAVGGSGYFDGSGDYLTAPDSTAFNLTSGNFTLEAWVYWLGSGDQKIFSKDGKAGVSYNQYALYVNGSLNATVGSGNNTSYGQFLVDPVAFEKNTWVHVAFVKNGSQLTLYKNGTSVATAAQTGTMVSGARALYIGYEDSQPSSTAWNGYISNARIVKGTAVYTGAFTPPSLLPLTNAGSTSAASYPSTANVDTTFSSSNTSLLLNYTNAGITDATAKNDLETVGNAQISTSVSKFGGGSIYLDGSSSYLRAQSNAGPSAMSMMFGTGPYTIEMWVYQTSRNSNGAYLISNQQLQANITSTGTVNVNLAGGGNYATTTTTVPLSTWTYIAFVRTSTSANGFKIYINGVDSATGTDSTNYSSAAQINIGTTASGNSLYVLTGYIDDLRITNYARTITASPTAPFPVQ